MSVSTLDGFLSFKDEQAQGASEIALAHIKESGSLSDWRLLNSGWMMADAVLGSGAILRSEPTIKWVPGFDDMIDYRVNVLKKPKYPMNVVLTGSGDIDLKHPIFHDPELHTLILTSKVGFAALSKNSAVLDTTNTKIEVIGGDTALLGGDELTTACELLYSKYNVRFLDVTAGGVVIGALVWHKLIDEMRVTMAGQLCGETSATGEKRPRLLTGSGTERFTHHNNPHLHYYKVGIHGVHHIFVRGLVRYRHGK